MTTNLKADKLDLATAEKLREAQVDITGAAVVDVQSDTFMGRHRLWVNVNGICVLRVCQAERVRMIDLEKVNQGARLLNPTHPESKRKPK